MYHFRKKNYEKKASMLYPKVLI